MRWEKRSELYFDLYTADLAKVTCPLLDNLHKSRPQVFFSKEASPMLKSVSGRD